MKIKTMQIINFCGIKSLCITPQNGNLNIFGDNATGKTTIANAFMWLFTGKGITGTAELDPQPVDGSNSKAHNLETSVELQTDSGTTYKRVLSEVWQTKRGSATEELTGMKTSYFIDGVPHKEKEYTAKIECDFTGAELFKILSITSYFSAMDWKARRKLLIDVCGGISLKDVFLVSEELMELETMLDGHSVEDYQKIVKAKKTDLCKEIDMIPARISENENNIPQLSGTLEEHQKQLEMLNEEKADIDTRIAADTSKQERKKAVLEVETEILKARNEHIRVLEESEEKINAELRELIKERSNNSSSVLSLEATAEKLSEQIERLQERREHLVAEYRKESAKKYEGEETCPCCGQALPPEKIELAKAEFNKQKAQTLEAINMEGQKCSQTVIDNTKHEIDSLYAEVSRLETINETLDEQINNAERRLEVMVKTTRFEETDTYKQLAQKLESVKAEPEDKALDRLKEQAEGLKEKIAEETKQIALFKAAENAKTRITELEAQKKKLATEYARCEKGEYLCELFIRTKVSMLDDRINSRFKTIRFKLFHTQANGGISEVCKVLIPCESGLVEYEKANNAAKINAGIEIINVLSEHFGLHLPVFVDNAESVTELYSCDSQVIRLVVSESDKKLRIENF